MKLVRSMLLPACLAVMFSAGATGAEGWATSKSTRSTSATESSSSDTMQRLNAGTKKFVRGTIDVVTLKPLWSKKKKLSAPSKPWLNNTHTKNTPKKESFLGSLLTPDKSSQPQSMKDFVGAERPS
jgi:hypothetical protein